MAILWSLKGIVAEACICRKVSLNFSGESLLSPRFQALEFDQSPKCAIPCLLLPETPTRLALEGKWEGEILRELTAVCAGQKILVPDHL